MDKNYHFDKLTKNMFQNLSKSIEFIETDGKTSIIYYFSALELMFKARLFKEHWSFILQNIDDSKININNFKNGDFLTVSFDVAASRIRNLFQDLDDGYEKHFEDLRKIRNRLIHFDCSDERNKDFSIENISKTWYYTNELLSEKWKGVFVDYKDEIINFKKKLKPYIEHFWNSKKEALLENNKNKYANASEYTPIRIHNKPFICNFCEKSYVEKENLSLLKTNFDNKTYTLTETCGICEHEDYLFLFSYYLQKNKSINLIRSEFKKFIEGLWQEPGSNSVNYSHYERLLKATPDEIQINFNDVLHWGFDDFEIEVASIDKNCTEIKLKFYNDFDLEIENCPAYYVLYTDLIFTLNLNKKEIQNSDFAKLFNSIDDFKIKFFIDSDGF